jgi:peptidyl-tRNA hydrolase, PTH2 family
VKQVIVVNEALRLTREREAIEVARASIAAFLSAPPEAQRKWLAEGMPKCVVHSVSAEDLVRLEMAASGAGLVAELIRDPRDKTANNASVTCLGLGPADDTALDAIAGDFGLTV